MTRAQRASQHAAAHHKTLWPTAVRRSRAQHHVTWHVESGGAESKGSWHVTTTTTINRNSAAQTVAQHSTWHQHWLRSSQLVATAMTYGSVQHSPWRIAPSSATHRATHHTAQRVTAVCNTSQHDAAHNSVKQSTTAHPRKIQTLANLSQRIADDYHPAQQTTAAHNNLFAARAAIRMRHSVHVARRAASLSRRIAGQWQRSCSPRSS